MYEYENEDQYKKENPKKEVKTLFDLDQEQRELVRVRLVNKMTLKRAGNAIHYAPIELLASDIEEVTALIDLVQANTKHNQLAIVGETPLPGLELDSGLETSMSNPNFGNLNVRTNDLKPSTLIFIKYDQDEKNFLIKFGYSVQGSTIYKNNGGGFALSEHTNPNSMIEQSLLKLHELTGDPNFLTNIGLRIDALATGLRSVPNKPVDKFNHYQNLGLSPYILKTMSDEMLEMVIKGIRRGIAKSLHPDRTGEKSDLFTVRQYTRMLESAKFLEDKKLRNEYSSWL